MSKELEEFINTTIKNFGVEGARNLVELLLDNNQISKKQYTDIIEKIN